MGTGGGPGGGLAQWREALAGFDRWRTRPTNRAGPGMFVIAALAMAAALALPHTALIELLAPAVCAPLALLLAWYARRSTARLSAPLEFWPPRQRALWDKLHAARLAERIAAGAVSGTEPHGHTRGIDGWFAPQVPITNRIGLLRHVVVWLEWYAAPATFARHHYLGGVAVAAFMLVSLILALEGGRLPSILIAGGFTLFFLGVLVCAYADQALLLSRYLHEAWDAGGRDAD